jgi:hypothetical protein
MCASLALPQLGSHVSDLSPLTSHPLRNETREEVQSILLEEALRQKMQTSVCSTLQRALGAGHQRKRSCDSSLEAVTTLSVCATMGEFTNECVHVSVCTRTRTQAY